MFPNTILMVKPNGYRVEYSINPHMLDKNGNLNVVNEALAQKQWENLRETFVSLNKNICTIDGVESFPDMVFCANQTFSFIDNAGNASVILSRMKSEQRQGEIEYFKNWAEENNLNIHYITDFSFEGCGDAIWNYDTLEVFGGYGFRTNKMVYDQIENIIGKKVIRLELVNPNFYHLDTCFVVLNKNTIAYVEEAFSEESLKIINAKFENKIKINLNEAINNFAGNAFSVDGKNIVLHKGASHFIADIKKQGFIPHEVDVSEYLKSGGAVFCMKQVLF